MHHRLEPPVGEFRHVVITENVGVRAGEKGGERPAVVRADIQALRALAVAAVVIYHLWPNALPGGYVGVDVFFVISGYLITAHIFREITGTGRIGFTHFWARRIRRLLPAAYLVLAASVFALVALMPRVVWMNNLRELGASAAYVENWLLAFMAVDYLAADASPSLAQHYWSLSVEEQFYVVWPVFLGLTIWMAGRAGLRNQRFVGLTALLVVAIVSLGASIVLTAQQPPMAFFATPTRCWEFALGGIVALWPRVSMPPLFARIRPVAGWAGLSIIIAACFVITERTAFPGWAALLPTAGAALVIAAGVRARPVKCAPVQWIGNHSYSIYLWHWPPIVALPWVVHASLNNLTRLGILGGTLLLAYVTNRFVETPIRTARTWTGRRWPAYTFAVAGLVALILPIGSLYAFAQHQNDVQRDLALASISSGDHCFAARSMVNVDCGDRHRRPSDLAIAFAAVDIHHASIGCQQDVNASTAPTWCAFGDTTAPTRTVAVVGNSYAGQFVPMLEEYGADRGWRILLAARTDCLAISAEPVVGQDPDDGCVAWTREVQDRLIAEKVDGVIFAAHEQAQTYTAGEGATPAAVRQAEANTLATLRRFAASGIPTTVIKHAPGTRPAAAPECVALDTADHAPCALPRGPVTQMDMLSAVAQAEPELTRFISLDDFFCDAEVCHAAIGDVVAYYDDHHIAETFARTLAEFVGPRLAID